MYLQCLWWRKSTTKVKKKNTWHKCLGFSVTSYGPDSDLKSSYFIPSTLVFYVTGSKVPKLSLFQHLDFKKWMPFPAYSLSFSSLSSPLSYLNLVVYLMFSLNVILSKVTNRFSKGTSFQQKSPSTLWSHLASLLSYMYMYLTADSLEKDRR